MMREGRIPVTCFINDTFSAIIMGGKRSILSGAATIWGVFIFVIIAGTANGINRGNKSNYDFFLEYAMISIFPGEVSIPFNGTVSGRKLSLDINDANEMKTLFKSRCQTIYPRIFFTADCRSATGFASLQVYDFRVGLDERYITLAAGDLFSETELINEKRFCMISERAIGQLYDHVEDAVGSTLLINGIPFKVRGVFETVHNMDLGELLIPFGTAMSIFRTDGTISSIEVKLLDYSSVEEKQALKSDIHSFLCVKKKLNPDDPAAFTLDERIDAIASQEHFLSSFQLFTGIVGVLSLLMGIIGVSSIVHLSVKERTREIAIRMVCGAKESSIFILILGEAVITMLIFGIIGMILAMGILRIGSSLMERVNEGAVWILMEDLTVTWSLTLLSTVLVIVCGIIAGFAPARKAVSINIINALTQE